MGIAIAALTLGAWFAYSSLKGVSLADAFAGKGNTLDPSGKVPGSSGANAQPDGSSGGSGSADSITNEMNRMIGLRQPYKWGGGHASFDSNGPWDCSGAVSWILHYAGMLSTSPRTSTGLMTWGKAGKGNIFTVYANPAHTFIVMETGKYAGQSWGTTNSSPGGGPGWHHHTTAGFVARHYEGAAR